MKSIVNIQEKLEDGTELYGWKSEPPLTPFAPNYVHYITDKKIFNGAECESWFRYLLEQEPILLDKFRVSAGNGGTGLSENSLTSRYPYFNVLKFNFHLVSKLKTLIFNGIKTILSVSENTNWQETLYANCWYNVVRQGESMQIHHHSYHKNSFYGFHLTINAIETFTSYYHPIKFQEEAFHTPNKIGYLTLFPNFIPHSVSLNRYETPRISIAGDIFPSSWLDESSQAQIQENLVEIGNL